MACDSITAVTSAGPRAPKRKDYQRVALAAAQQSAQAQAQAHVLVLEADDRIADAEGHLQQAQTDRDTAVQHRTAPRCWPPSPTCSGRPKPPAGWR